MEGEWLTLGETARRLGVTRSAVYGRIERKTLQTRPRGNRGVEVLWQGHDGKGDVTHDVTGDDPLVVALKEQIAELRCEREALVSEMVTLRERASRSEGAEVVLREALADLATRLDRASRPWWRRLVG